MERVKSSWIPWRKDVIPIDVDDLLFLERLRQETMEWKKQPRDIFRTGDKEYFSKVEGTSFSLKRTLHIWDLFRSKAASKKAESLVVPVLNGLVKENKIEFTMRLKLPAYLTVLLFGGLILFIDAVFFVLSVKSYPQSGWIGSLFCLAIVCGVTIAGLLVYRAHIVTVFQREGSNYRDLLIMLGSTKFKEREENSGNTHPKASVNKKHLP